ncbi:MAG TPA: hypothetical protein PLV91_01060, partial [Verrucomicrobiota bacterium]|nr:hypothetical protein [Verrucomicrobiota bacterium]
PVGELNIKYFNEKIKILNNIKNDNFIFSTYSLINKKSLNDFEIPTIFYQKNFLSRPLRVIFLVAVRD